MFLFQTNIEIFLNPIDYILVKMRFRGIYLLILLFLLSITFSFACIPNWQRDDTSCRINNTHIIGYLDTNNCNSTNYPYNNGWEDYCNYCSENLQPVYGNCLNGTQTNSWIDFNYYSCCVITNQPTDCNILIPPYNETSIEVCYWQNLSQDMGNLSCQTQPNVGINDKEYCIAHIPLIYSNETFKCIALIRNGYTNEIIQTTPEYKETSQTFFNLNPEGDSRQFFAPANNIVNFYYTGKNLVPDTDYILSIECSSENRNLKSEMRFQIAYENVSFVFFRTKWLMGNAPYIIGGIILLILLLGVGWLIYKGVF
jgi:hypothetical protein